MTTLKDAVEVIEDMQRTIAFLPKISDSIDIADELLGKYKGIIPIEKTSSEFIRDLRNNFHGKIR